MVKAQVILDIYSGKPNPNWPLSETMSERVLAHLASMPESAEPPVAPPTLGYRGFIVTFAGVTNFPTRWTVYRQKASTGGLHRTDDSKSVERMLLESGQPFLPHDVFIYIAEELAKFCPPS